MLWSFAAFRILFFKYKSISIHVCKYVFYSMYSTYKSKYVCVWISKMVLKEYSIFRTISAFNKTLKQTLTRKNVFLGTVFFFISHFTCNDISVHFAFCFLNINLYPSACVNLCFIQCALHTKINTCVFVYGKRGEERMCLWRMFENSIVLMIEQSLAITGTHYW